jgi:anti-sigma factor RsiW
MAKFTPLNEKDRTDLVAYLDGELDEKSARAWEVRLNTDPSARAEAEALQRSWELLDYLPRPEPSVAFTSRTLERLAVMRPQPASHGFPWRPWALGMGWAAAALLAAAGGFAGVKSLPRQTRTPVEQEIVHDEDLIKDLRILENFHEYKYVENFGFLQELDHLDLFGDDS